MADQSPNKAVNGSSANGRDENGLEENGHDSIEEDHGPHHDDARVQDESTERKRQMVNDDPVIADDQETQIETQASDQPFESPIEDAASVAGPSIEEPRVNIKEDGTIMGSVEPSIETQTFYNSKHNKDDLQNSIFLNPLTLIQSYPSTTLDPSTSQGFSATDMLEPEMEMIPISLSETTVQCPLCQLYFQSYQIELHASSCMDRTKS